MVGRNIKNKNTKIARSHKWLLAVDAIEDWQLYMMAKNRTFSTHRSTQPFKIKKTVFTKMLTLFDRMKIRIQFYALILWKFADGHHFDYERHLWQA